MKKSSLQVQGNIRGIFELHYMQKGSMWPRTNSPFTEWLYFPGFIIVIVPPWLWITWLVCDVSLRQHLEWDSNPVPALGPASSEPLAVRPHPEDGALVFDDKVGLGRLEGVGGTGLPARADAVAPAPRFWQDDVDFFEGRRGMVNFVEIAWNQCQQVLEKTIKAYVIIWEEATSSCKRLSHARGMSSCQIGMCGSG